jgi:LysM repeat protein
MPGTQPICEVRHYIRGALVSIIAVATLVCARTPNLSHAATRDSCWMHDCGSSLGTAELTESPPQTATLIAQAPGTAITPAYTSYVVQPGDSVESIARRFHDIAWLIRRRNGGLSALAPGRHILVWQWPFGHGRWAMHDMPTDKPQGYIVQQADSFYVISLKLHIDISTLLSESGLGLDSAIYPNELLVLHHYTHHWQRVLLPGTPVAALHTGLLLTDVANLVGVDAALTKGLIWHESGWTMKRGGSGEIGMVQIMPNMAEWAQSTLVGYPLDPNVPVNNILLGDLVLLHYLDGSKRSVSAALALYHSGNVLPSERNQSYIHAVLADRQYFYDHPRAGF